MFLQSKGLLSNRGLLFVVFVCTLILTDIEWASAGENRSSMGDLADMELEALMNLEVTSVSKRVQPLADSPAAVYVITSDEIKRSGATSVANALRLAPGVEVARVNSSIWAVSIRGQNSMYSHSMLVLVDGRSVYSPFYGGVYWDTLMPMLEDIDRIEVIRGPGASLWGVNAVNGVINIISKSAQLTQGNRLVAAAGTEENHLRFRSGGKVGNTFIRGYAVHRDVKGGTDVDTGDSANDEMQGVQFGGRADWRQGDQRLLVQSDLSEVDKSYNHGISDEIYEVKEDRFVSTNGNLLTRWSQPWGAHEIQFQFFYDYTEREEPGYRYQIDTYDFDLQFNHEQSERHRLTWGFNYRQYEDEMDGSNALQLGDNPRRWYLYSGFVQDEYQFTDKLSLVAGVKAEKAEDVETAFQPTLRFLYQSSDQLSYWGSVSQAERIPTRIEQDAIFKSVYPDYLREDIIYLLRNNLVDEVAAGNWAGLLQQFLSLRNIDYETFRTLVVINGAEDFESEKTTTYELGLRWQPKPNVFVDLAGFYSQYRDLRSLIYVDYELLDNGIRATADVINLAEAESSGVELAFEFKPSEDWRFKFNYNHLTFSVTGDNGIYAAEVLEGVSPNNQFSFRTYWNIDDFYSFDFDLYYVDEIEYGGDIRPKEYADLNLRFAMQLTPQTNLSFVLLNLFHEDRYEYQETLIGPVRTEIDRSIYLQLEWKQ